MAGPNYDPAYKPANDGNFFDQFDDERVDEVAATDGYEPTLGERFINNYWYQARNWSPEGLLGQELEVRSRGPDAEAAIRQRQEQEALDWEQMSWSDTPQEYAAAFGGAIAGTMMTPSSYVFTPLRIASAASMAARPVLTSIAERAAGAAVTNTAMDTFLQGTRMATGRQEDFSLLQTGISVLTGGVLGAGEGALVGRSAARANFFDKFDTERVAEPPKTAPKAAVPAPLPEGTAIAAKLRPVEQTDEFFNAIGIEKHRYDALTPEAQSKIGELWGQYKQLERAAQKSEPKPVEVTEFIKRLGGIKDETGEVSQILGKGVSGKGSSRPGVINNKTGIAPDKVREALVEAGYLKETSGEGEAVTTVNDVFDLLDRSVRGDKVYSELDSQAVAKLKADEAKALEQNDIEALASFFEQKIQETHPEFELFPHEIKTAAKLYRDGVDNADTAIEKLMLAEGDRGVAPKGHAAEDIPFQVRDKGQTEIPGTGQITVKELLQRRAAGKLKPTKPQQGAESLGGLFGDERKQLDLIDQIKQVEKDDIASRQTTASTTRPASGVSGTGEAPRMEDIIGRLTEASPDPTAFRKGRVRHRKASGQFDRKQGVVRVRDVTDFETLVHEIAHSYERGRITGKDLEKLKRRFSAEVKPLAYPGAKDELSEGFAEFLRYYVSNPSYAASKAPGFLAEFETLMARAEPEKLAILQEVRESYRAWQTAPSGAAVRQDIISHKEKGFVREAGQEIQRHGLRAAIGLWWDKIYKAGFDRYHFLDRAVDELLRIHALNTGKKVGLIAADDAYKLQRLAVDSPQAGFVDLMHGVVPYKEVNPFGPSMHDALQLALGKKFVGKWDEEAVRDFGTYLAGRRTLAEFDRFAAGEIPNPPSKFSRGDWEIAVEELEAANPQWADAADMIYSFQQNLLEKKHAAGFLTDEQFEKFSRKVDYVPLMREMADFGEEVGTGAKRRNQTGKYSIVNAFRGSNRSVVNPLESIMRDAIETSSLIARNDVFKALANLGEAAGPGGGTIIERIPSREVKGTRVGVTQAIEMVGKELGLDPRDVATLRDFADQTLGEGAAGTIFRAGEISERGEPIIYVWRNGEKQAYRLADGVFGREMYSALTGMGKEQTQLWLKVLSLGSTALRSGIVTSPDFLFANFVRDQMTAWILTDVGYVPFATGLRGVAEEVRGGEYARLYAQAGGVSGGTNVSALHDARVARDIQSLRKKGYVVQHVTSIEGAMGLIEMAETGTRVGIFKKAYERGRKEGLSEYEALIEGAYTARDYMDFGRHGSMMLEAKRIIPFLNASLQGLDKGFRTLIKPFIKLRVGQQLSDLEREQLGAAAKGWAKVAAIGMFGLGLEAALRDNLDYEEVGDYLRATHWMIPLGGGQFMAIPKPFEFAVLSNIFERGFEAMVKQDPLAWERMREGMAEIVAPPTRIPGVDVYYELATNYDFFHDRSIVPDALRGLEPRLQWNAYTSELGKKIGDLLNVSPMYVDHAITGFGGSWGRQILNWSNSLTPNRPETGWEDGFITRRFIKDASRGSASSRQFWELIARDSGEWERVTNTYKEMKDNAALGDADAYLAGKPEGIVVYAMLNEHWSANIKRIHPLRRSKDAITTISKFRQEMANDNIRNITNDDKQMTLPSGTKGTVDDVLSRLSMIEARNGLIAAGVEGWKQKQIMDSRPVWAELKEASPEVYDEIRERYQKAHVYSEAGVRQVWPAAKARILQDREEAVLDDLASDARNADDPGDISDPISSVPGMVRQGTIDLFNRPKVANKGGTSTVYSKSFEMDGREVLVPRVSDDGRIMSEQEAIEQFRKTGQHLGIFDTPEHANAYAEKLHKQQEEFYGLGAKTR